MRNSFIHSFIALLFVAGLCSCQMEGPVSDITVHNPEEPRNELHVFSTAVTDGVVDDGALCVIPQLIADVDGIFVNNIYLTYYVDNGESVTKGPVETGRPVRYDLDWKVWTPGTHKVSGSLYASNEPTGRTVLSTFEHSFTITEKEKEKPVVEDDYLVSVLRGGSLTPLHTTETAVIPAGSDCTFKIDFKGKGNGKVSIKNIDYTFSLLDFNFGDKFEGEGVATIPFKTLKTGTAFVTVTFAREGKTYKPTFKIDVIL